MALFLVDSLTISQETAGDVNVIEVGTLKFRWDLVLYYCGLRFLSGGGSGREKMVIFFKKTFISSDMHLFDFEISEGCYQTDYSVKFLGNLKFNSLLFILEYLVLQSLSINTRLCSYQLA